MDKYDPAVIEPKWQKVWEAGKLYQAVDLAKKPKYYLLVEFPYPSGAGLHVGHVRSWSAMDAYARKIRREGKNVLYPMGWDAFGLPAENYALKMGIHPSITVSENITNFKRQCQRLGLSFDWTREINTTDPKYYKWTQWIFLQLYKHNMAYRAEVPVNWCPFCKTNLADEEVLANGTHERCGNPVERRLQKQWMLRITKYADRLIDDLKLVDFSPAIAAQQINWIGKKDGLTITYKIKDTDEKVEVFTTRPDTNFGAAFIVLAPEHPLARKITTPDNRQHVDDYIAKSLAKSEIERQTGSGSGRKDKTGAFTGRYAINPLTEKEMPIYVSDFVLMDFGTGAVVGVPGHDLRDFEFAKQFKLPIVRVVVGKDHQTGLITEAGQVQEEEGRMINSGFLDGLDIHKATVKIMDYLEEKGWGKRSSTFHLRDWIFSRQHYWGEPIPIIYCDKCGIVPVPEKDLPVELPYLEKYQPSGTGESPLANAVDWLSVACPECRGPARRETDTMPNWAGSNWYFLRYLDPSNNQAIAGRRLMDYWLPVDLYQGGFEHTTLHLLYSRFIYKFLFDIGLVPNSEPYLKRRSHGIVLGPDNRKMSKSFGNVVNPDDLVKKYGADAVRLYELFIGPFSETVSWSDASFVGCFRFLERVWKLSHENVSGNLTPAALAAKLQRTISKVGSDIGDLKFNTLVAALMEFSNDWAAAGDLNQKDARLFISLLAPFAPHIAEELWQKLSVNNIVKNHGFVSVHQEPWPKPIHSIAAEGPVTLVISINGKPRGTLEISTEGSEVLTEENVIRMAKTHERVANFLAGKEIKKVVYIPGKIVNFAV